MVVVQASRLGVEGHMIAVEVTDVGIGFDPSAISASGLSGLNDRGHELGGLIAIDSRPGAGTRLTARLPIEG